MERLFIGAEAERSEGRYDFRPLCGNNQRECEAIYKSIAHLSIVRSGTTRAHHTMASGKWTRVYAIVTPYHPSMYPVLEKYPSYAERDREIHYLLGLL